MPAFTIALDICRFELAPTIIILQGGLVGDMICLTRRFSMFPLQRCMSSLHGKDFE